MLSGHKNKYSSILFVKTTFIIMHISMRLLGSDVEHSFTKGKLKGKAIFPGMSAQKSNMYPGYLSFTKSMISMMALKDP